MSEAPKNAVLRSDVDASSIGLYASLGAGGLMLAYAIYKVTVANVSSDYAFLTLGVSTAIIAFSVIGLHEWGLTGRRVRLRSTPELPES